MTNRKEKNTKTQNEISVFKKIFPLNRIAPGGPWINVKVLAAAESTASIWLGFNFRDGLMPLVVLSELMGFAPQKLGGGG